MKVNIGCILTTILFFCSQLVEAASASPNVTVPAIAYANHIITHTFYINEKVYAVLDDNSLWEFNSDQTDLNETHHDYLINHYVTIMPDTGTLIYPVKFVISNKTESFTVNLVSIPSIGLQLIEVDSLGEFITFNIPVENHSQLVEISPNDREIVKKWQKGQKIVVGGVWFPEFDPQGRSDCGYLFSLYNYETKEFARFDYR